MTIDRQRFKGQVKSSFFGSVDNVKLLFPVYSISEIKELMTKVVSYYDNEAGLTFVI